MGTIIVDQIGPGGALLADVDTTLSEQEKNDLLLYALPGGSVESYAGVRVLRFQDQVILKRQVTHLGRTWPGFKKRIQIPPSWLTVERRASAEGLVPRFVGIYHYGEVTIFVDFDPSTYIYGKANNSAAHVATNDLYQAQKSGVFSRSDRRGNRLTSVRSDKFASYLTGDYQEAHPRLDLFSRFSEEFFADGKIRALDAIERMHAAQWPDTYQGEWPGFYLEYRLDEFLRKQNLGHLMEFQKDKARGRFDYDLVFKNAERVAYYGDLKASDVARHESPGNDAANLRRCIDEFGSFWYVIYEHRTWHARDNGDLATIEWNEWKRSVGYRARSVYNPLSYARRFKESVHFERMNILEVNKANFDVVLRAFAQGQQQGGAPRAIKVMIDKRNIDNFLIFSAVAHTVEDSVWR